MRSLMKAIAAATLLIALLLAVAYASLRHSLPTIDGTVAVDGISAPVEIVRDADQVPHIFASTRLDALFGLGYVHAQDRLWQMEFQRRIGHGRLAEIFGKDAVPQDRFLRTVGFGRAARAAWRSLPDDGKEAIDAYVAGVNAFLGAHRGFALPPEFTLLHVEPEPWSGVDVLVWSKMMAWDLSANYSFELLRHDLLAAVGEERMADLMPPYPRDGLSILTRTDVARPFSASASATADRDAGLKAPRYDSQVDPHRGPERGALRSGDDRGILSAAWSEALSAGLPTVRDFLLSGVANEALGSNNWVVDGTLTATGRPLLANDPHLATRLPSTWYLAHMSADDFDVIGATLPGTPAVALGRNRFIAWGATNMQADVEDLYRERLDATGKFAEFRDQLEPLRVVAETIAVRGSTPVHLDVRVSRHGPIVSDAINANNAERRTGQKAPPVEPLALRWTALDPDDTTVLAFLRLNAARDWKDFTEALRLLVVPSQNFVYADAAGHIGYYAPGRIPIRERGDGSRPADGRLGDAEWNGWIPFDDLPHTFDPPDHLIVTANNRPVRPGYPYLLALEWPEPYRAQRITDRLHEKATLTPDDFASIQSDTLSLQARALLPLLLSRAHARSAADEEALALLRQWNDDARGNSAAAAIFEAWFLRLAPAIAGDELGPLVLRSYEGRFTFVTRFVTDVLRADPAGWCDDIRTPARETCDDAVSVALDEAVAQLRRQMGQDMGRWQWEAVHHAVFPHQGFDSVGLLRPFVSRSVPTAGDWSTVDVGAVATDTPFEQHSVPGYRQIVDLSPRNDSRFVIDTGESGHLLSAHYDDFLSDWRAVRHRPIRMDRAQIESGARGHLQLLPSRKLSRPDRPPEELR